MVRSVSGRPRDSQSRYAGSIPARTTLSGFEIGLIPAGRQCALVGVVPRVM